VEKEHSWGLVETTVLELTYSGSRFIVKAGGEADHHIARELHLLHAQVVVTDQGYEKRENDKALAWLSGPHRIDSSTVELLRAEIAAWPTPPAILAPTHGDWQPRNWLTHDGIVSVIDFGRAAMRPALTDFARLAAQEFRRNAELETAFLVGYGGDPREKESWHRTLVREAIGTAGWAHQVGDDAFEAQGLRMIAEALSGRR